MELRTLRYFVTVAEELNITRAAERLHMSQPPLSSQIISLEDELNTTLFIRGRRRLRLTESGELLYRRAKEILSLSDKAREEISSMSSGMSGTISLGLVDGTAPEIAAGWIADFTRLYPHVRFKILDGNSDELMEKLRSGLVSLAVISAPFDELLLNSFPVGHERMSAMISLDNPLSAEAGDISIRELALEPLIVSSRPSDKENVYRWFRTIKATPNIICEMDSFLDAVALSSHNIGISIFPETSFIPAPNVVCRNIDVPAARSDYYFVWRKGRPLPIVEETFIDFVKDTVNSMSLLFP